MRLSLVSLLSLSCLVSPLAFAEDAAVISVADKSTIASTILCQNLPIVKEPSALLKANMNLIETVTELFGNNAKSIKSTTVGVNNDHQMSFLLNSPVSIMGIEFDTVNIIALKEQAHSYYQLTAEKPFTADDETKIRNIPQHDNLAITTHNATLSLICNVLARE